MPPAATADPHELTRARLRDAELRVERKRRAGRKLLLRTVGAGVALVVAGHLLFQGLILIFGDPGLATSSALAWGVPVLGLVSVMVFLRLFRRLEQARKEHRQQSVQDEELVERLRTGLIAEVHHQPTVEAEGTERPTPLRRG